MLVDRKERSVIMRIRGYVPKVKVWPRSMASRLVRVGVVARISAVVVAGLITPFVLLCADFWVHCHNPSSAEGAIVKASAQSAVHLPSADRIEIAARATWWSLREAVISDWNL